MRRRLAPVVLSLSLGIASLSALPAQATQAPEVAGTGSASDLDHPGYPGQHLDAAGQAGSAAPRKPHVDPLPDGVRPTDPTDTASLYRYAGLPTPKQASAEQGQTAAAADVPPGVPMLKELSFHVTPSCTGTGTDGNRVQVMYVREVDQSSRYTAVLPLLRNEVANVDDVFAVSSRKTGGGRRVRWVTDADCVPVIPEVVVPDGALGGDFGATIDALAAAGHNRTDRKYLAFAEGTGICGIANIWNDTRVVGNANDGGNAMYSRVDPVCWSRSDNSTAAHELMHNLGGVASTAPHATAGGHCWDESDTMCYDDGTGRTMQYLCPADQEALFDCNDDDYFSTSPAAGTYLAQNWNTASSSFLDTVPALGNGPTVTVTADDGTPETGDLVTFAASSATATTFSWRLDNYGCTTGPTDTSRLTARCTWWADGPLTATVIAGDAEGVVTRASTEVTLSRAAAPTVTVDPVTARAGRAFTLTADAAGKAPFTYTWDGASAEGCTMTGAQRATATVTCPESPTERTLYNLNVRVAQSDDQSTPQVWSRVRLLGTLSAAVSGPATVAAGESGDYTVAIVNPGDHATVRWTSARGWIAGATDDSTAHLVVPEGATGTDTLTAAVTAADGAQTSVSRTITVEAPLTLSVSGGSTVLPNTSTTLSAAPSRKASVTWRVQSGACSVSASTGLSTTVSCADTYTGDAVVRATATTATGESASVDHRLDVHGLAATTWTTPRVRYLARSYKVAARLLDGTTGQAVSGQPVKVQARWNGTRRWVTVATPSTSSTGTVAFRGSRAGTFRVRFDGSGTRQQATSRAVAAKAPVLLSASAKLGRPDVFRGKLTFADGAAVRGAKVVLKRRWRGSSRWVAVASDTTDRRGRVSVRRQPVRRAYYRWAYRGSATTTPEVSSIVRVRLR